ncbi:hypothetical protein [Haloarchaeobius baliensis]|uniref:hypothetical protein n=1 Tax=Haloarchaeobius baliensis TaxID=1670458 RepID=UPI003F884F37
MTGRLGSIACSPRQYRWLDRTTKLGGIALIAAGLEVGGDTGLGIALAAIGVAVGLTTVIITTQ